MKTTRLPLPKSDHSSSGGNILRRITTIARGIAAGEIDAGSPYVAQLGFCIAAYVERYSLANVSCGMALYYGLEQRYRQVSETASENPPAQLEAVERWLISRARLLPKVPGQALRGKPDNKLS